MIIQINKISKNKFLITLAATLFISGCASPVPVATNFARSEQKVARTAHHWSVVADDLVTQTLAKVNSTDELSGRDIYIPKIKDASQFDVTLRDFMLTHIVNKNSSVVICKNLNKSSGKKELEIVYETKLIKHNADVTIFSPGQLTLLGAGVAVLRNALASDLTRGQQNIATIGAFGIADAYASYYTTPTRTELLITTTISENNRYIYRKSDVYYVPDDDSDLFTLAAVQKSECPGESLELSDDAKRLNEQALQAKKKRTKYLQDMCRINTHWC
jgi:hypothetical protein